MEFLVKINTKIIKYLVIIELILIILTFYSMGPYLDDKYDLSDNCPNSIYFIDFLYIIPVIYVVVFFIIYIPNKISYNKYKKICHFY